MIFFNWTDLESYAASVVVLWWLLKPVTPVNMKWHQYWPWWKLNVTTFKAAKQKNAPSTRVLGNGSKYKGERNVEWDCRKCSLSALLVWWWHWVTKTSFPLAVSTAACGLCKEGRRRVLLMKSWNMWWVGIKLSQISISFQMLNHFKGESNLCSECKASFYTISIHSSSCSLPMSKAASLSLFAHKTFSL